MARSMVRQAEISAMDRIANAMDSLLGNPKALRRVTAWFLDEYGQVGEVTVSGDSSPLPGLQPQPVPPAPAAGGKGSK